MLEMAKDVGMVDVYGVTKEMRENRVNMIQTEEQYIFVYDALLEALQTGDTAIPCSEFRMEFDLLCKTEEEGTKSKIQEQFEVRIMGSIELILRNNEKSKYRNSLR